MAVDLGLPAEDIRRLIFYDPNSGEFRWRVLPPTTTTTAVGSIAGSVRHNGYRVITVAGRSVRAHRLAWFLVNGYWPSEDVDHINGDRDDNRVSNLRLVSRQVNIQNERRARTNNVSGFLGVWWSKGRQKWRSSIRTPFGKITLGTFSTPEAAHAAYLDAKRKFHEGCTI